MILGDLGTILDDFLRIWDLFGMILGRCYFPLGTFGPYGLETAFPKLNGRSKCVRARILPAHFQELAERHDSFFATANHPQTMIKSKKQICYFKMLYKIENFGN